ncbi:hypothetical protein BDZ91DRAFT_149357 [Kalaharituber pfeilii]|nr:hypothetical protein BDZ91DRAFT_149357 [Kalaharituber pfeilii]
MIPQHLFSRLMLYYGELYRPCILKRNGHKYEVHCGGKTISLYSTLENEDLPDVGIKDSQTYTLVDITTGNLRRISTLHWLRNSRLLLVCQEVKLCKVMSPHKLSIHIPLRRITTLQWRGPERAYSWEPLTPLPLPVDTKLQPPSVKNSKSQQAIFVMLQ